MNQLHYLSGAAGTGKTFELANKLIEWFRENELSDYQKVLALTRMHGARKRLQERLVLKSVHANISVSTVDSFALQIVNRWRLSFNFNAPVVPDEEGGFFKDEIGIRATFDEVMNLAAELSGSQIVVNTIANSYPIILVDEFQDCTGAQLQLISNLMGSVFLVLAADPFQALDGNETACEWLRGLDADESVVSTHLTERRRTSCSYILEAADSLLENRPAKYSESQIPFLLAPNYAFGVWKVTRWSLQQDETAALIYPAHRAFTNFKKSVESQNRKRVAAGKKVNPFHWCYRLSDNAYIDKLYGDFTQAIDQKTWMHNERWRNLYSQALRISKARGLDTPSDTILKHVVTIFVQSRKYIDSHPLRYEATTIHGAKNREFDHVYVAWDNNLCTKFSDDQKRRLLYNAITRARKSCVVVAIGSMKSVLRCPVLSLLGKPQPPN